MQIPEEILKHFYQINATSSFYEAQHEQDEGFNGNWTVTWLRMQTVRP